MDTLERNWWAIGLRGIVAVAFGILALAQPALARVVVLAVLGAWWLVDGVFAIIAAVYAAEHRTRWWPLLVEGISGIVLGLAVYFLPGITTLVLVLFVAAWLVVIGAFRIVAAVRLREVIPNEWLMVVSGVVSILLGALVWLFPGQGLTAIVVALGVFALILGVLQLVLAGRLYGYRRWHRTHEAL